MVTRILVRAEGTRETVLAVPPSYLIRQSHHRTADAFVNVRAQMGEVTGSGKAKEGMDRNLLRVEQLYAQTRSCVKTGTDIKSMQGVCPLEAEVGIKKLRYFA